MNKKAFVTQLGAHICKVRKRKGYSQDRLCLEGDFSRGTLSKIENGLTSPEVYTLFRIAEVLEIDLWTLVDFDFSKK